MSRSIARLLTSGALVGAAIISACAPAAPVATAPAATIPPTAAAKPAATTAPPATTAPVATSAPVAAAKPAATTASVVAAKPGGTLTFAARMDIDTLDPQRTTQVSTRKVLGQMFSTLVVVKLEDQKVYASLAESWSVADDLKSYTFKLKQGVKFHDWTPFNAAALKFTFDRIMQPPQAKGVARAFIGPYVSTDVIDEYTARVNFERPYAPFLQILSVQALGPISPTAVQKYGEDFGRNPVGTGPFMFKEWITQSQVTMVRNPDYNWAPPIFEHQGPATLDQVIWKFVPEAATRVAVLETGEVNIAEDLSYQDGQRVRDNKDLQVLSAVPAGTPWTAFPNTQKFPTDQLSVRRAIEFGIDREALATAIFKGESKASYSVVQPNMLGYAPTFSQDYQYDPEQAKSLLEADGWSVGSDGIRVKDGKRLELFWIIGTGDGYDELAPLVQGMLRDVGMDIKLDQQTEAQSFDSELQGLHNLGGSQWWFPDPMILQSLFHTRAIESFNIARLSDPSIDAMLDQAVGVPEASRVDLYKKIQDQVASQADAIPLVDQVTLVGVRKNVGGYKFDNVTLPLLYDVSIGN